MNGSVNFLLEGELVVLSDTVLYKFTDSVNNNLNSKHYCEPFLETFEIIGKTDQSYIISYPYDNRHKKAVLKNGMNLFAFKSIDSALFNYLKKKEKQIKILKSNLARAEGYLKAANKESFKQSIEKLKEKL